MNYEDITIDMLGTRRQRPMYLSKFTKFRESLDMKTYPRDPHDYTQYFLTEIDSWITNHSKIKYLGLDTFVRRDAILGTTHQLDDLHMMHGKDIVVFEGEYKYHRRLTDFTVNQITDYKQIHQDNVLVMSYPSCITTGALDNFEDILDRCYCLKVPVHIDGAWFGQCRNLVVDLSHPAIKSVSVSLSKAFGMGSQRIGIRYTREKTNGPITIMNDFSYCNVSDMWLGVAMMKKFGVDYWWNNYNSLYSKVCRDFNLEESNSIHVAWQVKDNIKVQLGIRTPLRMLIEDVFDIRGTDLGLNTIEKEEAYGTLRV
jgi:hypothetical protein